MGEGQTDRTIGERPRRSKKKKREGRMKIEKQTNTSARGLASLLPEVSLSQTFNLWYSLCPGAGRKMSLGMHETRQRTLARPAPSDSYPGEQGSVLPQFYSGLVALFVSMWGRALLPSSVELEPKGPTHPPWAAFRLLPPPSPTLGC